MSDERLDGPRAEGFLTASLALAREAATSSTWFETSIRSLEAAYGERPLIPAPTLAFDLTALLLGERLLPIPPPTQEPVREAMRGYEDHVLARLTSDRRWTRLTEAIAGLPKDLRSTAVGVTVAQLLTRLKLNEGTGVSTGIVRRLATRSPEEVLEAGRAALYDPEIAARLVDGLVLMAKAARRTRELLSDAEVFLLENLTALKGLGPRVQLAQLAETAQAIEERLPTRLRGTVFEDGDAPTSLEEDSAYPVGGFSSISTVGSLENLVTSELIYMEQGDELRPDLFDVRFVEGELLYYARDESVAVRKKRALVFVFDPSLMKSRVKDRGDSYQRLVWLFGTVTALVRKLSEWLSNEALQFELRFSSETDDAALLEEEGVLSLLLREFRERGQVDVMRIDSTLMAISQARETHRNRARIMYFTSKMRSGLEGTSAPDAIIDVGASRPRVHWADGVETPIEQSLTGADAWAAVTRQILDGVMKRRT
ncbi:MAG: hypothetical protein QM817_23175 [Archangium sp.]